MPRIASPLQDEAHQLLSARVPESLDYHKNNRGRLKKGRKAFEWEAARRILKIRFQKAGITSCEATFPHECWRTNGLSFAHSKKRRDIVGDELYEVGLVCTNAHNILELLPKEQMREEVCKIIASRPVPVC